MQGGAVGGRKRRERSRKRVTGADSAGRREAALRAFLAVDIPDNIKEAAGRLISSGRSALRGVRWVAPSNLHVTVKFLGPTRESSLENISVLLRKEMGRIDPFWASFGGIDVFPSMRRPRVIFLGMTEGKEEMISLIGAVEEAMEKLNYEPESRQARPHLTVGRVKNQKDTEKIAGWFEENRDFHAGSCEVNEVQLMKSDLRPAGPLYTILDRFRLGDSDS